MKRRFLAMIMAVVMCLSLASGASAYSSSKIEDVTPIIWNCELSYYDGRTVVEVRLYDSDYGQLDKETLIKYQPYYVVTDDSGNTVIKRHFNSDRFSLELTEPGDYFFTVYDSTGKRMGMRWDYPDGSVYFYDDPLDFFVREGKSDSQKDDAYRDKSAVLDVSCLRSDVYGTDNTKVDLWLWFTRTDDPELPIDDEFLEKNAPYVEVSDFYGPVFDPDAVRYEITGDSMHLTVDGPGLFEVNVYDKERTKQSAGEYLPMRVAIAGKNRVVDHALADRWADVLLEKHTDYYTAYDRDKFAEAVLMSFWKMLGVDDVYLFDLCLDEAVEKAVVPYEEVQICNYYSLVCAIINNRELVDIARSRYWSMVRMAEDSVFTDVPDDIWYAPYVKSAARSGLVKGKAEGVFAPDASMTIAEAVTLAARFEAALYEDIDPAEGKIGKRWYYPYIWYARERGIPCDYEDYNAKITREEFAHIFATLYKNHKNLYDEAGIVALNDVPDGFIPDVAKDDDFADDIYTLYRLGVLSGSDSERSFLPDSNIKRSEVAAILCRLGGTGRVEF